MEESKVDSVQPEQVASGEVVESNVEVSDQRQESVKYDTYRKVLGEKKKLQGEFQSMQSRLQELEEAKLADEGKKDELIDQLRKRLVESDGKYRETVGTIAYKTVSEAVINEAVKAGCQETELLLSGIKEDLQTLDYGADFSVDREQVKSLVEKAKSKYPTIFSKPAPAVKDGVPRTPSLEVDRSNMTADQLLKQYAELVSKK